MPFKSPMSILTMALLCIRLTVAHTFSRDLLSLTGPLYRARRKCMGAPSQRTRNYVLPAVDSSLCPHLSLERVPDPRPLGSPKDLVHITSEVRAMGYFAVTTVLIVRDLAGLCLQEGCRKLHT